MIKTMNDPNVAAPHTRETTHCQDQVVHHRARIMEKHYLQELNEAIGTYHIQEYNEVIKTHYFDLN
jgi:hypothetical protein